MRVRRKEGAVAVSVAISFSVNVSDSEWFGYVQTAIRVRSLLSERVRRKTGTVTVPFLLKIFGSVTVAGTVWISVWLCADCGTSAELVKLRVLRNAGAGDNSVSGAVNESVKLMLMYSSMQTAKKATQIVQSWLYLKLRVQQGP